MSFQLVAKAGQPDFLDLPWDTPLEEWESDRLVEVVRGIGRHVVRFVDYDGVLYALKRLPRRFAFREYRLLRELADQSIPVVEAIGVVTGRGMEEDEAVLLWMYALVVEDALPSLVRSARAAEVPASEPDPAGLVSPSVLEAMLDREMECLRWGGQSCTLLRISLHPKEPPDPREEILLQGRVLQILRRSLRPADAIAPEPTGDLLVLLPEMGAPEGQLTAQKVRRSLIQSRVLGEESRVIRALKIAQATCPEHGRCREELMRSLKSHT